MAEGQSTLGRDPAPAARDCSTPPLAAAVGAAAAASDSLLRASSGGAASPQSGTTSVQPGSMQGGGEAAGEAVEAGCVPAAPGASPTRSSSGELSSPEDAAASAGPGSDATGQLEAEVAAMLSSSLARAGSGDDAGAPHAQTGGAGAAARPSPHIPDSGGCLRAGA